MRVTRSLKVKRLARRGSQVCIAAALMASLTLMGACGDDSESGSGSANNTGNNAGNNEDNNAPPNNEDNNVLPNNTPNNTPNNNDVESVIGAPCFSDTDCDGGFCIVDDGENGFSEGYCTALCNPFDPVPCSGDGVCIDFGDNNFCVDGCAGNDECRDGYGCFDFANNGDDFCFPAACREDGDCPDGLTCGNGACGDPSAGTGDACADNAQCAPGDFCIVDDGSNGFTGGYCTGACQVDEDCSGDGVCFAGEDGNFCLAACQEPEDCRDRYSCINFGGDPVCVAGQCADDEDCEDGATCENAICGAQDAAFGDPCGGNDDCRSGDFCILPNDPNTAGFVDGYCSSFGCDPFTSGSCGEDGVCIAIDQMGNGLCLQACQDDTICREGGLYECRLLYEGLPEDATACLPTTCFDDADCPEDFSCDLGTSLCQPN